MGRKNLNAAQGVLNLKPAKTRGIFERPAGSDIWWISYFSKGQHHREKVGSRQAAIAVYQLRKTEIRLGKFFPPDRSKKITFRELAAARMEEKKLRLAPRSYRSDKFRLAALLAEFGDMPAELVRPDAIARFLNGLREGTANRRESNRLGSTVNRYRSLLSSIFSYGVQTEKLALNPVRRVPRFKESDHRVRFLDVEEEKALRTAVRELGEEYEAEIDLALNTGIRRGEQFGLKWENVDLERGILTVTGKTGRRFIPINSAARAAIGKLWRASNGSIFVCSEAKREGQDDWRKWFAAATVDAKVDNFRWHDLRHTFASRLVMAGVSLPSVQQYLGHRSILTTQRYAHLSPDHQRENIERLVDSNSVSPTSTKTSTAVSGVRKSLLKAQQNQRDARATG
jgi:integrase